MLPSSPRAPKPINYVHYVRKNPNYTLFPLSYMGLKMTEKKEDKNE